MMRHAILIVSMTLLTGAIPLSADQQAVVPSANAKIGALRNAQTSSPYSKLFEVRSALTQAVQQESQKAAPTTSAPKKRIVCGMTIIEVGPELDPKMAIAPPKDQSVRYTIRAIEPPVCNASAAK
jgi:hypothetical protein